MSFRMVHALGLELPVRSLDRGRSRVDNGNLPDLGFGYGIGVNNGGVDIGVDARDILDLDGVDSDYEAFTVRSESDSIDSEVSTISGVSSDNGSVVCEAGSVNSDKASSSVEDPEAEVSLSSEVGVDRQEVEKKQPKPVVFTKDSLGSSETHDTNWANKLSVCDRASWWITTSLLCKSQESCVVLCTTFQRTLSGVWCPNPWYAKHLFVWW